MLTPDNQICLVHGLIREPGQRQHRLRISIHTRQGKVSAMADFADLRPIPGTKPFAVPNARNPILNAADIEDLRCAPPSNMHDGYALFAGADSIIPNPPPPPRAKPTALEDPIPAFLRAAYRKDRDGRKLEAYPKITTLAALTAIRAAAAVIDRIDMDRLAEGVRAHSVGLDRRSMKRLAALKRCAKALRAIAPLQD
jgi:hypothetical protein